MEFKHKKNKELVADLETRQQSLENEYISNYNALRQKQGEGFADDSEEVQEFARNMQTINSAHTTVTAQLTEAKALSSGADKEKNVDIPIPVEVLPESIDEEELVTP